MNLALFYDFESTGLVLFKKRSDLPEQPHIVQLAASLVDLDTKDTVQSINVIVKPEGWIIPKEASDVHGITTEHALDVGIPESKVVSLFYSMWQGRLRVGHNEQFDARIMRIALKRFTFEDQWNAWADGKAECTLKLSKPILQIPPTVKMLKAGFKTFKSHISSIFGN